MTSPLPPEAASEPAPRSQPTNKTARKAFSTIVAVLISVVFLYIAFLPTDLGAIWGSIKNANILVALLFLAVTWVTFFWRALRWQNLLEPHQHIPLMRLFPPLMIGFGLNSILPGRAGELARPLALKKVANTPWTLGFSTTFVERMLDALALLGLFAVLPFFLKFGADESLPYDTTTTLGGAQLRWVSLAGIALLTFLIIIGAWIYTAGAKRENTLRTAIGGGAFVIGILAAVVAFLTIVPEKSYTLGKSGELSTKTLQQGITVMSVGVAVLAVGILMLLFDVTRNLALRILHGMPFMPAGLKSKFAELFTMFAEGFDSLKHPKLMALMTFHSLGVWLGTALTLWIMAKGYPGIQMSFPQAVGYLVITCLAIAIPAAPGYWGLYEVGGMLACRVLGITDDPNLALGYTLVVHALQYALVTAIGLYYAGKIHVLGAETEEEAAKSGEVPVLPSA